MILTRKILLPATIIFGFLLIGLLAYIYATYQATNREEERLYLETLAEAFGSEIENQERIALSISLELASDPEIQAAFASKDRAGLQLVSKPILDRLEQFNIRTIHFHEPNGITFLRVHRQELYGDDQSPFRDFIIEANTKQTSLAGIEGNQGGIRVYGITPVFSQGRHIGSVEVGIDAGRELLDHLTGEYGNEWHILITQESALVSIPDAQPALKPGPINDLLLFASSEISPIFNDSDTYRSALLGNTAVSNKQAGGRFYAVYSVPIQDHRGNTIGILDIVIDRTNRLSVQNGRLFFGGVAGLLALVFSGLGINLITSRALQPIKTLTQAAIELERGNLSVPIEPRSDDEVGRLSAAFKSMATQLLGSIGNLEIRVKEKTQDLERRTLELETISDVVREISTIRDLSTLLNVAVNLIGEKFGYYHTAIYLVDEFSGSAVLQAASGAGASGLLDRKYEFEIDDLQPRGLALQGGQAYVESISDSGPANPIHDALPESRSEILLPLRILNRTIGVLDIHSSQSARFDEQDIRALKLLSNQVAAAIENARLLEQVEGTVTELSNTYRSQTRKVWQAAVSARQSVAYEFDGHRIRPAPSNLPPTLSAQLEGGNPIILSGGSSSATADRRQNSTLLVPLMVFNELIGVIGLEHKDIQHAWSDDELEIAVAAANRAALTLENARLLEESQRRAIKERAISESTARIGSALSIENILTITAEEIERILGDSEVILQIQPDRETPAGRK